jgi:hypothetical protein
MLVVLGFDLQSSVLNRRLGWQSSHFGMSLSSARCWCTRLTFVVWNWVTLILAADGQSRALKISPTKLQSSDMKVHCAGNPVSTVRNWK